MEEELGALFSLQDLVTKFNTQDAHLDNLAVLGDQDGCLRELVILTIELVVEVKQLKHLLIDGTPAPTICLCPLCYRSDQVRILSVLLGLGTLRQSIGNYVSDIGRVDGTFSLRIKHTEAKKVHLHCVTLDQPLQFR